MTDFKIRRGLASQLANPRLVLEEGCWYLCTDTADLFLCVATDSKLELKRINGSNSPVIDPETGTITITKVEINAAGELVVYYANGDSQILGKVLNSEDAVAGIKVGDTILSPVNGVIELPDFAEKTYVDTKIKDLKIPTKLSDLDNDVGYVTELPNLDNYATTTFVEEKIAEAQLGGNSGSVDLSAYAKKVEIKDFIPNEYITETELDQILDAIVLHGGTA